MNTNTVSKQSGNRQKIVVIGGTGLIGKGIVEHLRRLGHDAIAASPSKGINAVTGEGLATALAGVGHIKASS